MPHGLRLLARDQRIEQRALLGQPFREGQFDRCPDRLDASLRRIEAGDPAGIVSREALEYAVLGLGRSITGRTRRLRRAGECKGLFQKRSVLGKLVRKAEGEGLLARDRRTRNDHVQRGIHSDQARQPLGASSAGQDAEHHLRQAELRATRHHAVMATHGDLKATAERHAVDRRDDRLGARLDRIDQIRQVRGIMRSVELGDIGTARKQLATATDHDRVDLIVRHRAAQSLIQAHAKTQPQRIDRRVVHHDFKDIVVKMRFDHGILRSEFC